MKIKSLLFSVLCMSAISYSFTSCSDDKDELIDDGSTLSLPRTRAYFLNEGAYNMNNAGITFYAPNKDHDKVDDIYMTQNKKSLGDTGQDMIEYDNNIYVVVFGSNLLVKLNSACVEQKRLSFPAEDGQPRYVTETGGKLYVTLYGGKVAKVDPKELTIEGYVNVGKNPEEIAENNGFLYVVNSGWGEDSTMTVISTADFKVNKTIEIAKNPFKVLESEDQIFILAYGAYYDYPVQKVDIATGGTTFIANATNMCEHNGIIYFVLSETNWSTYETINTFFSYNVKTGALNNNNFMTNMPSELSSESIYMMAINDETGEFYIGTSDYVTNGDIYRFDANKRFVEKFESGGVSPTRAVFF